MKQYRRNFLDIMMRITALREKEKKEEEREINILKRLAYASAVVLVVLNFFLLLDVYVLPLEEKNDVADLLSVIRGRRSSSFRISTANGRHIYIESASYGSDGDSLVLLATTIFDIPKNIFNRSNNWYIQRKFDGFGITRFCSPLLLLMGILVLVFRKKVLRDNYVVFISLTIAATTQLVLLIL